MNTNRFFTNILKPKSKKMNSNDESTIEEIVDEINDSYSNDDLYNITSWGADLSFRELISMYEENELLKPELQRKYVWEKPEASRFIESVLLGLPVPSIFLANTKDEKKLIIDGYQRIMTVYDYVKKGIWSKDKEVFRLSNTEKINKRWRNKSFTELSDADQRKIRSTTIHAILFEQKAPSDDDTSLYQVFERINTGGRALMPQEIRNCINQGKFNDLLIKLNKLPNWRTLFGKEVEDSRMRDMEFILRFFAVDTKFILEECNATNISLKKYLNEFMGSKKSQEDNVLENREQKFVKVLKFVAENIGENAFFNIVSGDESKIRRRFYPTIFDSICPAVSRALDDFGEDDIPKKDLELKRVELLKDPEYRKYISEGTMQLAHIRGRINLAQKYLFGDKNEQS